MTRLVIKYHREYRNLPMEAVKREFIKNCYLGNWYGIKPGLTSAERVKRVNHFIDEECRYYFELRCRGEEGWAAIKELCSHPDESARLAAAFYYRLKDWDYALGIIKEMAKTPDFWAPKTVRREVAFEAARYVRLITQQVAGKAKPFPDMYETWLQDLEAEKQGKSPKVKYVEAVVPYRGEYGKLTLEEIRAKFIEHSQALQAIKVDMDAPLSKELKVKATSNDELFKLYFELRERGEEGLNLLREVATSGPFTASMQAARLLQWQDTKLADQILTDIANQRNNFEHGTIEYETCDEATCECAVLGSVLEDLSYGTIDPYDQWKELQAKKPAKKGAKEA